MNPSKEPGLLDGFFRPKIGILVQFGVLQYKMVVYLLGILSILWPFDIFY
jgi:hypothetical protein